MPSIEDILGLMNAQGAVWYGREPVTLQQHSLQTARLAELEAAPQTLVAAALLHDLGHLMAKEPRAEGPVRERDDRHEHIAAGYLERLFGPAVAGPIKLHVDAKRFLCATQPGYQAALSPASARSLELQGGAFTAGQATAFRAQPHAKEAIRLRHWDDLAKDPAVTTKPLQAYEALLRSLASKS